MLPKIFNYWPKWWNFAKSGHTEDKQTSSLFEVANDNWVARYFYFLQSILCTKPT